MRKLILTTAAVAAAIAGAFAAEPSFGTFTDTRDGQTYKTAKMPDGKTWMTQNLNYQTKSGSWCYKNDTSYCDKYGRLYGWETAKKNCPPGWHLPTRKEWDNLVKAVGGTSDISLAFKAHTADKQLKAKSGWKDYKGKSGNGTDDYGFSALPTGGRRDGAFGEAGLNGYWWTASSCVDFFACLYSGCRIDGLYEDFCNEKHSFAVRCVADGP
ncbi:MAG: fibrobacter succinogenes major paralogous domain-containing protein [Chitinispirillales bacterium]|jgi:uncharacterized protein (TIGR02145 family)|nr:fibrobacter succinogenes major paralogous domain-containing protein [Chitinispirillales bacterium]